jgi:hypothetical protein
MKITTLLDVRLHDECDDQADRLIKRCDKIIFVWSRISIVRRPISLLVIMSSTTNQPEAFRSDHLFVSIMSFAHIYLPSHITILISWEQIFVAFYSS